MCSSCDIRDLKAEVERLNGIIQFGGLSELTLENMRLRKALEDIKNRKHIPLGLRHEAMQQIADKALKRE